ncbi:MAG: glycosyltransferase family 4 protein, partial [Thermoproteus sp.]
LEKEGIITLSLISKNIIGDYNIRYLFDWNIEGIFNLNSKLLTKYINKFNIKNNIILNFSNIFVFPSHIWYFGGSLYSFFVNSSLNFLAPIIYNLEKKLVQRYRILSKFICTVSEYVKKSLYSIYGISADCVIYPPIDVNVFRPVVSSPRGDYVLTYFGKETRYDVIKKIADRGVRIVAFGSKGARFAPRSVLYHRNIHFLGGVSISRLVDLYSNALFTLFPFTEEPFGYIPVESMACGTPVLTYRRQGPAETVIDNYTGWLADNDDVLVETALRLWKNGYDENIRRYARDHAMKFHYEIIANNLLKIILN